MSLHAIAWGALTLALFALVTRLCRRWDHPALQPVFLVSLLLVLFIESAHLSYQQYWSDTQWLVWLLGPAVVAFAVPIYRQRRLILANLPILQCVVAGGVFGGAASTFIFLAGTALSRSAILPLSLKSVTAPVAFEIVRTAGLDVTLVACGTLFAGVSGAVAGPWFLRTVGVRDPRAVGLALGCTSHGIGSARALQLGETQGAFASIGMSCTSILAALVCPTLLRLLI